MINGIGTNWGEFGLRLLMAFLLFSKTSNTSSGVVFNYSGKSLCGKNCYLQKKKMGKVLSFEDVYLLFRVNANKR